MSPYRVLTLSKNQVKHVMSAALHVDKQTGVRMILIQERLQGSLPGMRQLSDKDIAHRTAGKRTSHIHAFYQLVPSGNGRKYNVIDKNINNASAGRIIGSEVYTLSEGLEVAMHHYCLNNDLEVIQNL